MGFDHLSIVKSFSITTTKSYQNVKKFRRLVKIIKSSRSLKVFPRKSKTQCLGFPVTSYFESLHTMRQFIPKSPHTSHFIPVTSYQQLHTKAYGPALCQVFNN